MVNTASSGSCKRLSHIRRILVVFLAFPLQVK